MHSAAQRTGNMAGTHLNTVCLSVCIYRAMFLISDVCDQKMCLSEGVCVCVCVCVRVCVCV